MSCLLRSVVAQFPEETDPSEAQQTVRVAVGPEKVLQTDTLDLRDSTMLLHVDSDGVGRQRASQEHTHADAQTKPSQRDKHAGWREAKRPVRAVVRPRGLAPTHHNDAVVVANVPSAPRRSAMPLGIGASQKDVVVRVGHKQPARPVRENRRVVGNFGTNADAIGSQDDMPALSETIEPSPDESAPHATSIETADARG